MMETVVYMSQIANKAMPDWTMIMIYLMVERSFLPPSMMPNDFSSEALT